jgi:hypothetical protein
MKEVICLKCVPNSGGQNQSRMRSLFRPNVLKTGLFTSIAALSVTGMTWAQAGQLDTTFRNQRDISSEFARSARWQHESCVAVGWKDCLGSPFR